MGSFSFLLRICDDTQEWGRKYISELYTKSTQDYQLSDIALTFTEGKANNCTIKERIEIGGKDERTVAYCMQRFYNQAIEYITIFRDGQDTEKRDFSFVREMTIEFDKIKFLLNLQIKRGEPSKLEVVIEYGSVGTKNSQFGKDFFINNEIRISNFRICDENGTENAIAIDAKGSGTSLTSKDWKKGLLCMPLAD